MSSISSDPLNGASSFNFDYSVMGKRKSSPEQNLFKTSNDNKGDAKQENIAVPQKNSGQALFEQNLYESVANANNSASATEAAENGLIDKDEEFQEIFMARLEENGNDIAEAMVYARAETFNLIFEEELEKNGGNVRAAMNQAQAQMKLSDQELRDVLEDMVAKYEDKVSAGLNVDADKAILGALQEEYNKLDEKMSAEGYAEKLKGDDNTAANSKNENIVDPLMYFLAQGKEGKEGIEQKNSKQNIKLYETMLADSKADKQAKNHNGKPINIVV